MAEDTVKAKKGFNIAEDLDETEQKDFLYAKKRIGEMQQFRKNDHYGTKLDNLWAEADRAYIPHRLKNKRKRVVAEDETKGWRGTLINLGDSEWQSDIAQANPFVKISVALAVLIDQNPSGVFTATKKTYQATTELMYKLYQRSWDYARSKGQLKLFTHNLAKYGWAVGRTYPLRIERTVKVITEYDPENPDKSKYETKTVIEFNDVMRENLDPRNVWIDDLTRPNDRFSTRDWTWRKVYTLDSFNEEFGKYPLAKKVTAGGNTQETVSETKYQTNEKTDTDLVEVLFYESRLKDLFLVIANGVPVVIAPLPIADNQGNKKLSCWHAYWNLRHAMSPYGIGIYEAIRYDQSFLDRIRNMTVDQLTMSIYKMFFYQGTQTLSDTGDIKIAPGIGKQVLNPKDINWLEVPGPGADAYKGLEMFKSDVDEASGITEPLLGEVTGKTAFELAQAKEAALKRLKIPLDNLLDALDDEGYITVALIQLLYSVPETYEITDERLINDYLNEIQSDPELYDRGPDTIGEDGQLAPGPFTAKVFPEFPLNLKEDEQGNLIESKDSQFFRIKPSGLKWEGIINIKSQSLLSSSRQIDKALGLEMYNVLIPLFAQPPELYKKTAEDIIKMYDKDPRDILPDMWLNPPNAVQQGQLIVPQEQVAQESALGMPGMPQDPGQGAPTLTSSPTMPATPSGIAGAITSKATKGIR